MVLTSEYIYRGVSESDGHGALQGDVHADLQGTYVGAWVSSRDRSLYPYARADLELYLGHRFDLSGTWGATLSARTHYFVAGSQPTSDDYEQLAATLNYLDRWTLSLTAIPNAVRYWYYARLGRSAAWVAESSAQWLLGAGIYATGGAGYYYSAAPGGAAPGSPDAYPPPPPIPAQRGTGYAYGNAGIAWEHGPWRLEVGYFVAQPRAQQLFPYPSANQHVAGSLIWRF